MNPKTLDVGAVFNNTLQSWKRMAGPVTGLTAVMVLPFSLLSAFFKPTFHHVSSGAEPAEVLGDLLSMAPMVALWMGFMLLQIVAQQFYTAAVCKAVVDVQDGRLDATFQQLLQSVKSSLVGELIVLSILMALGVGVGLLLCVVPGAYLAIIWSVAVPVVVLERLGAMDALSRSKALVGENWLQVFLVLLVMFLLNVGLGIALCFLGPLSTLLTTPLSAIATTQLYLALAGPPMTAAQPPAPVEPTVLP